MFMPFVILNDVNYRMNENYDLSPFIWKKFLHWTGELIRVHLLLYIDL